MSLALPRLRSAMDRLALRALIITRPENRFYLSGFTGSNGALLITPDQAVLVTDFRYTQQARAQAPTFSVKQAADLQDELALLISGYVSSAVGFESDHVTVAWLDKMRAKAPGAELVPVEGLVESVRAVKTADELEKIANACELVDRGFEFILGKIRAGVREVDIALELEFFLKRNGAERLAFDIIVASGQRSSLPHGRASAKVIEYGEFVTIDVGAVLDGYCSDMTRTVVVGQASPEQRSIYDLVLGAQLAALSEIRAGRLCREIDGVARDIITAAGHGEHFGHGLGHGLGVVVHELPRLSRVAGETRLEPGNVVSVEPGVYIDGWGGVRIEDLVAVTEDGYRNFTASPKHLIQLG